SKVTVTPADLGLDYENVTLTTSDGVDLAAWYIPASSSSAVVVMHGAGSTRSDVLAEASVLHRNGFGTLLLDARGHGDSNGTAMDFGWFGDPDISAGTAYLATRSDVDPEHIGVVGFSMGGEEAIGAAATDPLIAAVVAEGATARTADDKAWLSDVYGWRGWLQEQIEEVQFGITDLLAEASSPTTLRDAVTAATDTSFLLVTAGTVADEQHAAEFIQNAAPERVTVWTVDGATHTGGLDAEPAAWEERVIRFLDENLGSR
ncbi:MAG TPA: alpha/beta fold hydrolase, partial [Ilumatobacteraceae bacterium]|nr:alpha/beta fold hydrolase [Ilumatobacteraceae bacterium]